MTNDNGDATEYTEDRGPVDRVKDAVGGLFGNDDHGPATAPEAGSPMPPNAGDVAGSGDPLIGTGAETLDDAGSRGTSRDEPTSLEIERNPA